MRRTTKCANCKEPLFMKLVPLYPDCRRLTVIMFTAGGFVCGLLLKLWGLL